MAHARRPRSTAGTGDDAVATFDASGVDEVDMVANSRPTESRVSSEPGAFNRLLMLCARVRTLCRHHFPLRATALCREWLDRFAGCLLECFRAVRCRTTWCFELAWRALLLRVTVGSS